MIEQIRIKNYKAFDDASLPLSKLTVLLGANSVGKSSLIQLLLLLNQTVEASEKFYKSALKLHGNLINMGDPVNLFRNKQDLPLTLEFSIKSDDLEQFLKDELFKKYIDIFNKLTFFVPIAGLSELQKLDISIHGEFKKYLTKLERVISKETTRLEYLQQISRIVSRSVFFFPDPDPRNIREFGKGYEALERISDCIKNNSFKISITIIEDDARLRVTNFEVEHSLKKIISITPRKGEIEAFSNVVEIGQSDMKAMAQHYESESTIFDFFRHFDNSQSDEARATTTVRASLLIEVIKYFQTHLKSYFKNGILNYVSPLRAHPKRYYMLDKAKVNYTLDTFDGDAVAEVLKENSDIRRSVNNWFSKFGLSVSVKNFKEVIHHLRVKQNNLELDITDVGFGISQVLPVILSGFLSPEDSYTIVEQPEIHLHPKMQADLADLFIAIVKSSPNKRLIIETHSEYLLKRLRRRISEYSTNSDLGISATDVSVCTIDPQKAEKGARLNVLAIEERGYFDWPIEFYGGELLQDTTVFLKNQIQNS